MGGIPAFVPGFTPKEVPYGALNFSSIIVWPHKLIIGEAYTPLFGGGDPDDQTPFPRSGYYTIEPYSYVAEGNSSVFFSLSVPETKLKYPRTHGRTMKAYLFNIVEDETEKQNLLLEADNSVAVPRALAMLQRIEWYARRRNG